MNGVIIIGIIIMGIIIIGSMLIMLMAGIRLIIDHIGALLIGGPMGGIWGICICCCQGCWNCP